MKSIVSALLALTVLASVAAPASAADDKFDPNTFFEQLLRNYPL